MHGNAASGHEESPAEVLNRLGQFDGEVLTVLREADETGEGADLYPHEICRRLKGRNWCLANLAMVNQCVDDLARLGMVRRLPTGEVALELLVPVLGEIS